MFGKKDDDGLGSDGSDDDKSVEDDGGAPVDDVGAMQLAIDGTRKFLSENPDAKAAALLEVVTNQQMASALKAFDKVQILVRAVFTSNFFKNKEVAKYAPAISLVTKGNRIMERHLIASLEAICIDKPKNFPILIKQLYDEDALDEASILEWADDGRSEYTLAVVDEETRAMLRGEAEPVVVWLQEADSEGDESGSDDE
jgi:translation initiation factor 5